ncbi:hypothetical protein [Zobellia barbeyronii]|uniref:Uncharacterized protein n=1 Tax=Zobellia barbeyronii TaxID=2748009 RepID=A0ABS5WDS7_9FLAO|nr:hypothetical protein [Zobellia barbeyronii]MBT2161554.1 hypothetical protein [Zobellia barbeyronii]
MYKFIILLLILFVPLTTFSQDKYFKLPQAKTQKPFLIFNKNIIGNDFLMNRFGTSEKEAREKIKEMYVLIDKQNRELSDYYNLTEHGLVLFDLKDSLISKTQSELNKFFGLDKQNEIYIDGYLLESKKYSIALIGITEIEIVEPDGINGLKNRVLNIWTLGKSKRYFKNEN